VRTLVLGLGNPLLGDDSVGLRVAEAVSRRLAGRSTVEVDVEYNGGLRLMERLTGYDRVILVDAVCTGRHPPGSVLRLGPEEVDTRHSASAHDVGLGTALRLGATMGLRMPAELRILAIEAERVFEFDESCTPAVAAAVPRAADAVLAELGSGD
jgi:hydrogenase maturation protease